MRELTRTGSQVRKIQQMIHQDDFKLVLHSLRPRTRKEYNINLGQFLEFCEGERKTIKRADQFDQILLHHIHYDFDEPGRGSGYVNKVLAVLKFYIPETIIKLQSWHSEMIG